MIQQLKEREITLLIVEQNTQKILELADMVSVLESGKSDWKGTAIEVLHDPGAIEAYLGIN